MLRTAASLHGAVAGPCAGARLRVLVTVVSLVALASTWFSVSAAEAQDAEMVANPYAGASAYVNPEWSALAVGAGGPQEVSSQPTGVWMHSVASIEGGGGDFSMGLAEHLDEALAQQAQSPSGELVFQLVLYNLPGRDCASLFSEGELGPDEVDRYESEFVDPIVEILSRPEYERLRVVAAIEPNSLPALVANVSPREQGTVECDQMLANAGYLRGISYAVNRLAELPNVYNYLDAGNVGWINTPDRHSALPSMYAELLGSWGVNAQDVHGIATNVASYEVLEEPWIDFSVVIGSETVFESAWVNGHDAGAMDYSLWLRDAMVLNGFDASLGLIVDTSRNGWGGIIRDGEFHQGPYADIDEYVDTRRVDRRCERDHQWNQTLAGIGERPTAEPVPGDTDLHAFAWIKPPGTSDGSLGDDKGFGGPDCRLDQLPGGYTSEPQLEHSPPWGHWYEDHFTELVEHAHPPLGAS